MPSGFTSGGPGPASPRGCEHRGAPGRRLLPGKRAALPCQRAASAAPEPSARGSAFRPDALEKGPGQLLPEGTFKGPSSEPPQVLGTCLIPGLEPQDSKIRDFNRVCRHTCGW